MAKTKIKTVYACQKCGAQRPRWQGQCTDCGAWNTFVEETYGGETHGGWGVGGSSVKKKAGPQTSHRTGAQSGQTSDGTTHGSFRGSQERRTVRLNEAIEQDVLPRQSTGIAEFDRVLGGGLVPGSFTLIGGDPGIGKSTLLMQMAGGLARESATEKVAVLYVTGEESVSQTAIRAQRLGVNSANVEIMSESNMDVILDHVRKTQPNAMVVDSIQTVYLPSLDSAPGTVSQVRECAGHLMMVAKSLGVSVFLIGHVTKDGSIAGPKVLEHMVDTVLAFEGDQSHQFRLLRALKNRFGAANELGVFQMNSDGLREVSNPSELFLEERGDKLIGSAVFASMEGSRPLLCEIQSLAVPTNMAMPRRTAIGTDVNRIHLMVAVLDKHMGLNLGANDIFLNVVGGLRVSEPALDLAVAASLMSSTHALELHPKAVFFGEVGLTGEVRAVSFVESRVKEAVKLGYKMIYLPDSNRRHIKASDYGEDVKLVWIKDLGRLAEVLGIVGKARPEARSAASGQKPRGEPRPPIEWT